MNAVFGPGRIADSIPGNRGLVAIAPAAKGSAEYGLLVEIWRTPRLGGRGGRTGEVLCFDNSLKNLELGPRLESSGGTCFGECGTLGSEGGCTCGGAMGGLGCGDWVEGEFDSSEAWCCRFGDGSDFSSMIRFTPRDPVNQSSAFTGDE